DCQVPVEAQTRDELSRQLQAEIRRRGDLLLLAPVVKNRKGFHTDVAEWAANHGYDEVRADGKLYRTSERLRLDRFREHNVEIVVGVLPTKHGRGRPMGASGDRAAQGGEHAKGWTSNEAPKSPQQIIDEALKLGNGTLLALDNHRQVSVHSTERSCPK